MTLCFQISSQTRNTFLSMNGPLFVLITCILISMPSVCYIFHDHFELSKVEDRALWHSPGDLSWTSDTCNGLCQTPQHFERWFRSMRKSADSGLTGAV